MYWWEIECHVSEEASEALAELLLTHEARGIATEDPYELRRLLTDESTTIFADPEFLEELPDFVRVRAYFAPTGPNYQNEEELRAWLNGLLQELGSFLPLGPGTLDIRKVQEEDWAETWKKYYEPLEISDKILVCPSWIDRQPKEGQLLISLDPGSAFGTGSHETTSLCLRLLPEYLPKEGHVLDLGCGSGILGIAAAGLGVPEVHALDIDEGAVRVTEENARVNGCSDKLKAITGSIEARPDVRYPLVLANLLATLLAEFEPKLHETVEPGGYLICSGIVETKLDLVEAAYRPEHWELLRDEREKEWVARVYRRKDN